MGAVLLHEDVGVQRPRRGEAFTFPYGPVSGHHAALNRARWQRTRRRALHRDAWRCRTCGRAAVLEVDHIEPLWRDRDQDPYALDGVQVLCRACHIEKTRAERRPRPVPPEVQAWQALVEGIT